jgi:putative ABC transport system permease protein
MGTLWKIALRNTVRHGRRTIITAVVMMAGIGFFIFLDSALAGAGRLALDNAADYTVSSLKVRNPEYVEDIAATPLGKALARPEAAIAALAAEGLPAAPRIRFVARLSNYTDEVPVFADAVDPKADSKVFALARALSAGTWLDGARGKSVVLGAGLADELRLKVGDPVLISAQTANDMTNADEYTVAGLVSTPAPEVNRNGLFMSLADARVLLDAPGLVTEVNAALPRAASLKAALAAGDSVAARLRRALPGLRVDPIGELAKVFLADIDWHARFSQILVAVVLLIAAVGIVNTIFMSVYSRVREIGVLRAYGMVSRDIARLFTLEGLIVGTFGSLLGVLLGVVLDFLIITKGIPLGAFARAGGWLPGVLRGEWNQEMMIVGFAFGVLASFVASLIPARRAAKLEPTAALRFQ